MLRVSPTKGVKRFGIRGKLSPRFIGPYSVIERIGKLAYLRELGKVHDVFHVSQLRRCLADESKILQSDEIVLEEDLSYVERPIRVLDSRVKALRNKEIHLVKVLWHRRGIEEATWEKESEMRERYPEIFGSSLVYAL